MDSSARILTLLTIISGLLFFCNGLQSDIYCLISIKDSLHDPFNYFSSWNFDNQTEGFVCRFAGIECWHVDESKVLNIRLSGMGLGGSFPRGIANCSSLTGLDLSNNNLSGPIPSDISRLIAHVTSLDLSSNNFAGEIPRNLANLSYLNYLKLDSNQLTGQIPPELDLLARVRSFSVAGNRLSGPVPNFVNAAVSAESYANNLGLCGGPLPLCKGPKNTDDHIYKANFASGFMVGWLVSAIFVFALSLLYLPDIPLEKFMGGRSKKKKISPTVVQGSQPRPAAKNRGDNDHCKIRELEMLVTRMSFAELMNATNNFGHENVIGLGKTGTMYKAILPNGWSLAVQKYFCSSTSSEGHYETEITILGRLRHINIVHLLGFCYEKNDRSTERLLVYKFMSNGNLSDWLCPQHGESKMLQWHLKVKIAVGLARGLAWLHHNGKFQVFHHNITSKCILLDRNFEPKISNFREAKFMSPNGTASSFFINGGLLELGYNKKDVYSFGVVLLELVTGKKLDPTDSNFSLYDVVDISSWMGVGFEGDIFRLVSVARKCIQSIPDRRPTMLDVFHTVRAIGEKHGLAGGDDQTFLC